MPWAWRRSALPVNELAAYALLVVLAVFIFTGEVSARVNAWLAAIAIVAVALLLSCPVRAHF